MRGLAAAVLGIAIALPVCAQHGGGGGHGGFAGHGASAGRPAGGFAPSHGSFGAPAPFRYSGGALGHAPTSYPSSMRLIAPGISYPNRAPSIRPGFYHPGHPITGTRNHNFAVRTYPAYPYAYSPYGYGYLPNDLLDDSDDNYDNYESQQQPPDYGAAYGEPQPQADDGSYAQPDPGSQPDYGYPQPVPQPGYGTPYPQPMPAYPGYPQAAPDGAYAYPAPPPPGYQPYTPPPAPVAPQMQYVPGSASTVILIYKDGRPPEQIQNFLATRSTLTVLDGGRRREIPLSDLNLPATISANHQTGVDFQLPTSR